MQLQQELDDLKALLKKMKVRIIFKFIGYLFLICKLHILDSRSILGKQTETIKLEFLSFNIQMLESNANLAKNEIARFISKCAT